MSRPLDVPNDNFVDAVALAATGSAVERTYTDAELPRLAEAGAARGSRVGASLRFLEFDGQPAVAGKLTGRVLLTCQRCMGQVESEIDEDFQVLIVAQERADEPGGYEPVIANASRLDLRWLVEDQVLLALPLVPMHTVEQCGDRSKESAPSREDEAAAAGQKPFQNLRDMMRKR